MADTASIGIIGGADGPTAIFLAGTVANPFASFEATHFLIAAALIILAYFIGNISPAILLGRLYGIDIKKEGSGNAGTTNVLRVLGKKAAVATLAIDILKGVIAVLVGRFAGAALASAAIHKVLSHTPDACGDACRQLIQATSLMLMLLCGLAVFCGHIWPALFRFKGGKGVATAFGVIVTVKPILGLVVLLVVLLIVVITKRVSAGSVIGAAIFPLLAWFLSYKEALLLWPWYIVWAVVMAVIILMKHRGNIVRLIKGKEPKLNFKK